MRNDVADELGCAFTYRITEGAWKAAATDRFLPDAEGRYNTDLYGSFDVLFGSVVVLHDDFASIPDIACQLASARATGFPDEVMATCRIDDVEGGWSLGMSIEPGTGRLVASEPHR